MTVAFSDAGWEKHVREWRRMERELLNRINLIVSRAKKDAHESAANFYPIPFRNDSGETIPAFAVMRITGAAGLGSIPVITVSKPSSAFQQMYLVNGPFQVSGTSGQNIFGLGTWAEQSSYVLYDDASTPAYGEEWGPSNGSWKIKKYRYGFQVLGGPSSGAVGIRQSTVKQFLAKVSGGSPITSGNSGTVTIYDGNEATTSDTMASVKNRTEITAGNDTWVRCVSLGGEWFLEPWECP